MPSVVCFTISREEDPIHCLKPMRMSTPVPIDLIQNMIML